MSHPPTSQVRTPSAPHLRTSITLNNGVALPMLGFGLYGLGSSADTEACVRAAIQAGYRAFDTAAVYGNERGLGRALRRCGVPRHELFVITKLWNEDVRSGQIRTAFAKSLARLQLDYVDLYLVHWPVPDAVAATWKAIEELHLAGQIRAVGVSNHTIGDLEEILARADIVPAVNQIEHHPYLQNRPLLAFCKERGIRVQAWSPLMRAGALLDDPCITAIAGRHGKTPAQVVLRWHLQHDVATVPKSATPRRMVENRRIFDFALSEEDLAAIATLDRDQRCGPDPGSFAF